jgi:ribonuclease P protein component
LVLYVSKNKLDNTRIGFTLTKKIGNAVTRNKVRRKMKEICRLNFENIKEGYDLVFIAKKSTVDLSYDELEKAIIHILKISKTFKK